MLHGTLAKKHQNIAKLNKGCPQNAFSEKVGLLAQQGGGGLTEAQVFVEIFQKQICLGKWPEM